jgi:hypothetical protein
MPNKTLIIWKSLRFGVKDANWFVIFMHQSYGTISLAFERLCPISIDALVLGKCAWRLYCSYCWYSGADPAGGASGAPLPPKIGKNMIFWRKIVIFHTKYLGSAPDIGGIVDHYCLNFLFIEKPRIEVESSYNTFTNRCTNIEWYKMRNRIINIRRRLTWKRTRLSLSLYKKSI